MARREQCNLAILNLNVGAVECVLNAGNDFYYRVLGIHDFPISGVIFDAWSNRLVTLHDDDTLVFSQIDLDPQHGVVGHQVLRKLPVPSGFSLCSKFTIGSKVVLYRQWKAAFGQTEIARTELILICLRSYRLERTVIPYFSLDESAKIENGIMVLEQKKNEMDVVLVEL